jgi:hypothetical protein
MPSPTPTPGPISLIQKASGGSQRRSSLAVSFPLQPTAGNLLVAIVGVKGTNGIGAPTDAAGAPNGWLTAINETGTSNPTRPGQAIFYKVAGASEPLTVREILGSRTTLAIQLFEYGNILKTGEFDGATSASGSGTDSSFTGTLATASATDLLLAGIVVDGSDGISAVSNSFTKQYDFVVGSSEGRETFGSADRVGSASNNGTTFSHGSNSWRAQVVAFKRTP